jgi:hypothetical protein
MTSRPGLSLRAWPPGRGSVMWPNGIGSPRSP